MNQPHNPAGGGAISPSLGIEIKPLSPFDLEAIMEIQNVSEQAAAWGKTDYARLAAHPWGMILVAKRRGTMPPQLLGFGVFHWAGEEAELWNLAVVPEHRRQGIAKALLQEACRRLLQAGVTRLFLEVRASNAPALGLYRTFDFKPFMRRKDYYQNPQEDALVLALDLTPSPRIEPANIPH